MKTQFSQVYQLKLKNILSEYTGNSFLTPFYLDWIIFLYLGEKISEISHNLIVKERCFFHSPLVHIGLS